MNSEEKLNTALVLKRSVDERCELMLTLLAEAHPTLQSFENKSPQEIEDAINKISIVETLISQWEEDKQRMEQLLSGIEEEIKQMDNEGEEWKRTSNE